MTDQAATLDFLSFLKKLGLKITLTDNSLNYMKLLLKG